MYTISVSVYSRIVHSVQTSQDEILIFFSYFSQKKEFDFMQIVPLRKSLHEMSNAIFWEQ